MDKAKKEAESRKLPLVVQSGPLSGNRMGELACLGGRSLSGMRQPSKMTMTIDEAKISRMVAERRGTSLQTEYMHVFAEVLLHEYRHAYDCAIGQFPYKPTETDIAALETSAEIAASRNYRELFGTTGPLSTYYDHAVHGNPDCI